MKDELDQPTSVTTPIIELSGLEEHRSYLLRRKESEIRRYKEAMTDLDIRLAAIDTVIESMNERALAVKPIQGKLPFYGGGAPSREEGGSLVNGYPKEGRWKEKIFYIIRLRDRFVHYSEIRTELDSQGEEYQPASLSATLSRMRSDPELHRAQYNAAHHKTFYGLSYMVRKENGELRYADPRFKPQGEAMKNASVETLEFI